ncbi:MAG: glycosyltransferase [Paracoccaceae bacterium]
MFTNTFSPHVGGVANSVSGLAEGLRAIGHEVLVVAPVFPGASGDEAFVIRIPALQQFGGSDFSLPIPVTRSLAKLIDDFAPEIVHSHHPFLLGGTALRVAAARDIPIIYTYHTNYELYGHYVAKNSGITKRLALNLALGYCDLCSAIIAPSQSTANFLASQNIGTQTAIIPTGVEINRIGTSEARDVCASLGIPPGAFVVGHVGRLAPEKNLGFLTDALVEFLGQNPRAQVLIAGGGTMAEPVRAAFETAKLGDRVHMTGVVVGHELASVYAAMDVFAFSSMSETQGLVLAEAMSVGTPVVALDASGVREIVVDGKNGRLLPSTTTPPEFATVLSQISAQPKTTMEEMRRNAEQTAKKFSRSSSVLKTFNLYSTVLNQKPSRLEIETSAWKAIKRSLAEQWKIFGNVAHAINDAVSDAVSDAVLTPDYVKDEQMLVEFGDAEPKLHNGKP